MRKDAQNDSRTEATTAFSTAQKLPSSNATSGTNEHRNVRLARAIYYDLAAWTGWERAPSASPELTGFLHESELSRERITIRLIGMRNSGFKKFDWT